MSDILMLNSKRYTNNKSSCILICLLKERAVSYDHVKYYIKRQCNLNHCCHFIKYSIHKIRKKIYRLQL